MKKKLVLPVIFTAAALVVVGYFCTRTFFYEFYTQSSNSMQPTLTAGDLILISKWGYGNYRFFRIPVYQGSYSKSPKRGEIFVFFPPNVDDRVFTKRVIGLPGDEVEVKDGVLYINSEIVQQTPLETPTEGGSTMEVASETLNGIQYHIQNDTRRLSPRTEGRWQVPVNHYFVLGDNRHNSQDSRFWGAVPRENFIGKLVESVKSE